MCLVAQSCLTLCDPMNCSTPGSFVHGDSPGKNTGVGCRALLQGIFPTQELNPGLLNCRQILYQLSHQGKPKNTAVGSLSLLQQTFPTWEFDWGLLHCRWILYQLRYQRSLYLQYLFSKCDSASKGISIMWRLVRNAGSQAPRMVISTFNRDCPGLPRFAQD